MYFVNLESMANTNEHAFQAVIVDFSATWCGPCKMLSPRLDAAVATAGDAVDLAIVDIDENADIAEQYGVQAWLPDGYSQISRIICVWPFGLLDYGSATLRCKI